MAGSLGCCNGIGWGWVAYVSLSLTDMEEAGPTASAITRLDGNAIHDSYDFFVENERIVRSGRAAIIAATSVNTITLSIGSEVSDCK